MFHFTTLPPLSLYIHIPWCVRKCPYCDFNSHQIRGDIPENDYVAALLADLEQDLPRVWGRIVRSIFIGGGTPSVLSPEAIYNLLSGIRARLSVTADAEITLEANPGTVDSARFQGFREAGINRLSLGIQSFNDTALQRLGRIHGRIEAILTSEAALQAGFNNINLDLMFGLPTQTVDAALEDLRTAIAFQPSHLSWYQLTIEPNTRFYHQPPRLPDDDLVWEIQTAGQTYLAEQGYPQYEISAYAKPGYWCQHNLNYWKFGDYLGIGAGAHGKISDAALGTITRLSKQPHPHAYLQSAHSTAVIANCTTLTVEQVSLEFMMNALRLFEGFTNQELTENTGLSMARIEKPVLEACARGWLVKEFLPDSTEKEFLAVQRIRATDTGMRFLNDVLDLFV
ncbi:MAG TPA: radical SAM family heme chaperone HemW [Thioploca sp.]|nr:MAG: YggW family oxidoreductase [Beggiatoa sp. 4572_84]RKZ59631.1 MAG: YggW family oxidoreductase [Gammaproteobacteria bacterium]HDN27440.1 radical SAM family heme chaperone HemW [Thioploca sp.]